MTILTVVTECGVIVGYHGQGCLPDARWGALGI